MAKEFTVIAKLSRDEHKTLKKLCKEATPKVTIMAFVRAAVIRAISPERAA